MAERQQRRKLSCQLHGLADRYGAQKLAQVYRWLVPDPEPSPNEEPAVNSVKNEKTSRHLP
jgi:hypothetical protein